MAMAGAEVLEVLAEALGRRSRWAGMGRSWVEGGMRFGTGKDGGAKAEEEKGWSVGAGAFVGFWLVV